MSLHFIWRRLISKEVPLSSRPLSIAICLLPFNAKPDLKITPFCTQTAAPSATPPEIAFNAKPNTKGTHFCTQTVAPSTTPLDLVAFREFLLNKCGFTEEDFTKVFGHRNRLLRISIHKLEQVLELLYGCGLTTPAQIRTVVRRNPNVFFYKSETQVKTRLNLLRTFMKEEDVSKLVYIYPIIFQCSENRVRSTISLLQKLGVEGESLSYLLVRQPRLFNALEEKIMESFKLVEDLGVTKGSATFAVALRSILGVGKEALDRRLHCLRSLGFSEKQIQELSSKRPLILGLTEESLKRKVDFVVNYVGLPLATFVNYTSLFTYSLEKRLIPRYRVMEALKPMRVVKTELSWPRVFQLSEKSFLERYVTSNAESSSILWDIYRSGKAGKLIMDKETGNVCQ